MIAEPQEPPDLWAAGVNPLLVYPELTHNIWYGGQIRDDHGALVLRLFAKKPSIVDRKPLTVAIEYKQEAIWSDGVPVTVKDLRATWRAFTDPASNVISRTGWEDVKAITGSGKKGLVVFRRPYAEWESLVSAGPYPAHVLRGRNLNEALDDAAGVSSGPWLLESWKKGVEITARRNPRFTAYAPMKLEHVVFRFVRDPAGYEALKAGEAQVMAPSGEQFQIRDFLGDPRFVVDSKPSYGWEHLDVRLGSGGHPALRQPYVRRALIAGINRRQITDARYATVAPDLPLPQSVIFRPFEKDYRPNWAAHRFDQQRVIDLLRSNGCTGGPRKPAARNDGIFRCPGVGTLSFGVFSTAGGSQRDLVFEIMKTQLRSVGIELVKRFQPAGTLFGTTLPSGDWDLMMFSWSGAPSDSIATRYYGCGGPQNFMGYCNRRLSAVLDAAAVEPDARKRARMLNSAEARYLVRDVPTIPLYVRPVWVIHTKSVKGPVANPAGPLTWNISDWTG